MKKRVIVIGGGVAGMQAAITLDELGFAPLLLERSKELGGKLTKWDRLFPTMTPAHEVLDRMRGELAATSTEVRMGVEVASLLAEERGVRLSDGTELEAEAVIAASGFDLFDASFKEEYGYGLYPNVITSVDLERMFASGEGIRTAQGAAPERIAFLHCVGSRDAKVDQHHCSRVCCITGVKQAIELKQELPTAEIYSFYMDMRMFGSGYEELYRKAQEEYNIHFVRGRISEAATTFEGQVRIKAEDTLIGRPMRMSVDMLVLIVGMQAGGLNESLAQSSAVELYASRFVRPLDSFTGNVCSHSPRLFYAGTVSAPKNIGESINEGATAAHRVAASLKA